MKAFVFDSDFKDPSKEEPKVSKDEEIKPQ